MSRAGRPPAPDAQAPGEVPVASMESVAIAVARAAVQKALAAWIADRSLADERRKELRELLPKTLGERIRRTAAAAKVERLVQDVDAELDQWIEKEIHGLPDFERS